MSVPQECPTKVSCNSVPQECLTRVSLQSVPQGCPATVSHKSVLQECPTRASYKSVPQECPTRVSYKSVLQEYPTRVSYKSVPQEFPTRVSHKSVPQECPARVPRKSVSQECPTRVSYKSDPQECPTRVSYKSVIWTYVAFRTCLHSGSWAPSCFFIYKAGLRIVNDVQPAPSCHVVAPSWSQKTFLNFSLHKGPHETFHTLLLVKLHPQQEPGEIRPLRSHSGISIFVHDESAVAVGFLVSMYRS